MKNKKIICLVLALSLALGVTACSKSNSEEPSSESINQEGVLATVNGEAITQAEYDETLAAYKKMVESQYGEGSWDTEISEGQTIGSLYEDSAIMDNMILEIILMDAAEKQGITMTDDELNTEFENYKAYFSTDEEYESFLDTNGMTEEYLKDAIKKENIINKFIDANVENLEPSDGELQQLFTELKMGEQVKASHILVKTEEEANAVLDRINKGESFEDLAKELSIDPSSGANGGDLGFFSYSDMVEPFSEAAFSMEIGQISDPVKSDFGYHIIKVTDKSTDDAVTIESEKSTLTDKYKSNKYEELISNLKSEAKIERK